MNFRFYLTISSSRVEVHPLNFLQSNLTDEKVDGQIYHRRTFEGELTFAGDDFDLIYLVEQVEQCTEIILEIEEKNSGLTTYHNYWTGYFSPTDGKFDLDNCTFKIKPKSYDNYKEFDEGADVQWNIIGVTPVVTTHAGPRTFTRNRWLVDAIEYIAGQMLPGVPVQCEIFNRDINYVTNEVNKFKYLTIAQKTDIKTPLSTNAATLALISWNELMHALKMFNIYWMYDGTTIIVEHVSYFDGVAGMDLRTQRSAIKSNKYSYNKEDMPQYEKFSFMEAGDTNYITGVIKYADACINKDPSNNVYEYTNNITTDIDYIKKCMSTAETYGNIDDDGFVIMANYLSGGNYYVYYGYAYENMTASYNYPLSWSYLLRAFFRHDRVLMSGTVNNVAYNFFSARKTKLQEVNAVICYADNYDPANYMTTELGETWFGGEKGYVKKAVREPSGKTSLELLYGPDEDGSAVMPPQIKTMHIVTNDIRVITTLSEPNIYDTYYWIWTNDSTCQEVMIPAGTTYDVRDLDEVNPITSYKFNLSDASISGWYVVWNEDETIVECTDTDCGGAVPPAVPAAPVLVSVTQSGAFQPVVSTWNASADATYYELYRKPNLSMGDSFELVYTGTNLTFSDYDAADYGSQAFYYKVKACNISGCSGYSNEISITTV